MLCRRSFHPESLVLEWTAQETALRPVGLQVGCTIREKRDFGHMRHAIVNALSDKNLPAREQKARERQQQWGLEKLPESCAPPEHTPGEACSPDKLVKEDAIVGGQARRRTVLPQHPLHPCEESLHSVGADALPRPFFTAQKNSATIQTLQAAITADKQCCHNKIIWRPITMKDFKKCSPCV